MLVGQLPEHIPDAFFNKLQHVVDLMHHEDLNVKKNASALLAAASADEDCWKELLRLKAGQHIMQELEATQDDGVRINALALLTAIAQGGEEGMKQVLQHGAMASFIAHCSTEQPARIQEAAADALCQLATDESLRQQLADAGAVQALCTVLSTADQEVCVRSLMGLGMLLSGNEQNQVVAAGVSGTLAAILKQMKQTDDPDCHIIARDLFGLLGKNPEVKQQVAAALREAASSA